jgi:hypothetical protein
MRTETQRIPYLRPEKGYRKSVTVLEAVPVHIFNSAPRHEGVFGSGGIAPSIL